MVRPLSQAKLDRIVAQMQQLGIDVYICTETESNPDVNVRYITGYSGDNAYALISDTGKIHLIPWDIPLAKQESQVDKILDTNDYKNSYNEAILESIKELCPKKNPTIGVSMTFPYYKATVLKEKAECKIIASGKLDDTFDEARATKEPYEIALIQKAMTMTNKVIDLMEEYVHETKTFTETDLALFVENNFRRQGAEGVSFATLCAARNRSWQIHTKPPAGHDKMKPNPGLALIDCGLKYQGYCTDVTIPFIFGKETKNHPESQKIVKVVEETHNECANMVAPEIPTWKVAEHAKEKIEKAGYVLPHSIGHGLGLATHDSPHIAIRPIDPTVLKDWQETKFKENMIITVEPGIYQPTTGGFRWENDFIVTKNGCKKLTNSRIIYVE